MHSDPNPRASTVSPPARRPWPGAQGACVGEQDAPGDPGERAHPVSQRGRQGCVQGGTQGRARAPTLGPEHPHSGRSTHAGAGVPAPAARPLRPQGTQCVGMPCRAGRQPQALQARTHPACWSRGGRRCLTACPLTTGPLRAGLSAVRRRQLPEGGRQPRAPPTPLPLEEGPQRATSPLGQRPCPALLTVPARNSPGKPAAAFKHSLLVSKRNKWPLLLSFWAEY